MAKLIRDRSTKEKDEWWRSIQEAAKKAPKLTYERSAPMANSEDVLERYAPMLVTDERNETSVRLQVTTAKLVRDDAGGWVRFEDADALAAENEELRGWRDRAVKSCAERKCAMRDRDLSHLRAEVEKLRADVVWALKTRTAFTDAMVNGPFLMIDGERVKVDGTDAGLLDAVRRAREGTDAD